MLIKRKLYIQARQFLSEPSFEVVVCETELPSDPVVTVVQLGVKEVEIDIPDITMEEFNKLKTEQLEKLKADIMKKAQDQCAKLG